MDMGKEFTSDKLTDLMKTWSEPILGWKMTISIWRHILTAFRRKLCRMDVELIEQDAISTVHALQAGHSVRTDKIYGLSQDAFAGVSEDMLDLFLYSSTDWQKATGTVPGGLALPYKESRRECFDALVEQGVIKMQQTQVTPQALATASKTIMDPSISKMFAEFQQQRSTAEATMAAKQDETLTSIASLHAELKALRSDLDKQWGYDSERFALL